MAVIIKTNQVKQMLQEATAFSIKVKIDNLHKIMFVLVMRYNICTIIPVYHNETKN